MKEYSIGESAWFATAENRQVSVTCEVCFGKLAVVVILGDGTHVQTPCEACGKGYGGPRGVTVEWQTEPRVEWVTVARRTVSEDGGARAITYYTADSHTLDPARMFERPEAALACAQALMAKAAEEQAKRSDYGNKNTVRNLSWSVSYHMREAKEHRRQAEYHEARAVVLKGRIEKREGKS